MMQQLNLPIPTALPTIKAVTLWQPWATFAALGLKGFETRPPTISWRNYRGTLLIHAAQRKIDELGLELIEDLRDRGYDLPEPQDFPLGSIVAIAQQDGSLRMVDDQTKTNPMGDRDIHIDAVSELERMVGDWRAGRLAIPLLDLRAIAHPIEATGAQGLWTPKPEVLKQLEPYAKS